MKADPKDSHTPFDPATIRRLLDLHEGKIYLNTVFEGGAFKYLENCSAEFPVLILDVRSLNRVPVLFRWKETVMNETFPSIDEALGLFQPIDIYINHLYSSKPFDEWPSRLESLSRRIDLHLVVHDFFSICPSVYLLNHQGEYCDIPDAGICKGCIAGMQQSEKAASLARAFMHQYEPILESGGISAWHERWGSIIRLMKTVTVPSENTSGIFLRKYDDIARDKIRVVPHHLPHLGNDSIVIHQHAGSAVLEIFLLGNISDHKGARLLDDLLNLTAEKELPFRFNILGTFNRLSKHRDDPHLRYHGSYGHEDLMERLHEKHVDVFLFPSIWPETFSYVIHEMKATGLPIIATDIGAHADALREYKDATLIKVLTAEAILETLTEHYRTHLSRLSSKGIIKNDGQNVNAAWQELMSGEHVRSALQEIRRSHTLERNRHDKQYVTGNKPGKTWHSWKNAVRQMMHSQAKWFKKLAASLGNKF